VWIHQGRLTQYRPKVSIVSMHTENGHLKPWLENHAGSPNTARHAVHMIRSGALDCESMIATAKHRTGNEAWEHRMFGFGTMTMGSFLYVSRLRLAT